MSPKRARASTSSTNNDAEQAAKNLKLLEKRKVVTGRAVEYPDIPSHIPIRDNINNLGYGKFLQLGALGNPQTTHIRHFYSFLTITPATSEIKFRMYDRRYTLSFERFAQVLEVPIHGEPFVCLSTKSYEEILAHLEISAADLLTPLLDRIDPLPTTIDFKDQALKVEVRFLNKVVISNILPKKGDTDRLDANQLFVLYCLVSGRQFNLFYMMLNHMDKMMLSNRGLPYGRHLNCLFKYLRLPEVEREPSMGILDHRSLGRMGRNVEPSRAAHPRADDDDEYEEMSAPTDHREEELVELRREVAEFRGMVSSRLDDQDAKFLDIQSMQAELHSMQVEMLRRFDTHFPPPQ